MNDILDNREINEILEILENMQDEELSTSLLFEFNEATRHHGQLLMNRDPELDHDDWKQKCDDAAKEVDLIIKKIQSHRS